MEQTAYYPVVIVGGGLVGATLAVALGRHGVRVALIDKASFYSQQMPEFDGRVSAISLGSQRLLAHIGVWPDIEQHAQPIRDIRVAEENMPHHVHYDHRDVGSEPMGYIAENRHTRIALQKAVMDCSSVDVYAPAIYQDVTQDDESVTLTFDDGRIIKGALLVAADGKFSQIRERFAMKALHKDYGQTAIVATIAHERPHNGLAVEHFMPTGPFAVLPMKGNRSSLVWAESVANVEAYLRLDEVQLNEQIQQRVGQYLGAVSVVGQLFHYPLTLVHANHYSKGRVLLVGDAAHGMHPIAGQGVNLGFRDVAVLVEALSETLSLGLDPASAMMFERYTSWRRVDTVSMLVITDMLTELFSNNNQLLRMARNIGFSVINKIQPLKNQFMLHAMGTSGDLPPLMQPYEESSKVA